MLKNVTKSHQQKEKPVAEQRVFCFGIYNMTTNYFRRNIQQKSAMSFDGIADFHFYSNGLLTFSIIENII